MRLAPDDRWISEHSNGQYTDKTFPRGDEVWSGVGLRAVRMGLDTFAVRLLPSRSTSLLRVGEIVSLSRNGERLTCEVLHFELTRTDEIHSKNCGVATLRLQNVVHHRLNDDRLGVAMGANVAHAWGHSIARSWGSKRRSSKWSSETRRNDSWGARKDGGHGNEV